LDLAGGSCTLSAVDPNTGKQDQKTASVSMDPKQNIKMARVDFELADKQFQDLVASKWT